MQSFLFGATDKILAITENLHKLPPVVIMRLRNMTALDATGLFAIEEVARQLQASKRTLILCGARRNEISRNGAPGDLNRRNRIAWRAY